MSWTSGGLLLFVALVAGATGALLYARGPVLWRALAPWRRRMAPRVQAMLRRWRQPALSIPPARLRSRNEVLVLMPDGRPWPLGAAVQILELAWRWQVVHGANLPLRARQGEGAYVWRPPLPTRSASDQQSAEAER